jgi:hypothetical protein
MEFRVGSLLFTSKFDSGNLIEKRGGSREKGGGGNEIHAPVF